MFVRTMTWMRRAIGNPACFPVVAVITALLLAAVPTLPAQQAALPTWYAPALPSDRAPPPVAREFRGVWIATVGNLDWPSRPGLPVDSQRAELVSLLDRAVAMKLNAVIFQVRPEGDALYKSPYEPWSAYLTGTMGKAPAPAWDPLAFAVTESHRRGLELHAWFNPFRARYSGQRSRAASNHVSRTMPALVKRYGPYLWMDPGEPAIQDLTRKVIVDVVKRYDIDGVHLDDYFYPYPERDRRGRVIPFPDARSWQRYERSGGTLSRDDWRRQNVDQFIERLSHDIRVAKPWVRFGVSPFGIWRPGTPASVRGFDAWQDIYADSRRWLEKGWVDYLAPQLYWAESAPQQSFSTLLEWWAGRNAYGRHLWPGLAAYKVTGTGSVRWPAREIVDQVRIARDQPGVDGQVHFNMAALIQNSDSVANRLASGPYAVPSLVPASPWLSSGNRVAPDVTRTNRGDVVFLQIRASERGWSGASSSSARSQSSERWWLVRARYPDGWRETLVDATVTSVSLPAAGGQLPDLVAVNGIDRAGVESRSVLTGSEAADAGRDDKSSAPRPAAPAIYQKPR